MFRGGGGGGGGSGGGGGGVQRFVSITVTGSSPMLTEGRGGSSGG